MEFFFKLRGMDPTDQIKYNNFRKALRYVSPKYPDTKTKKLHASVKKGEADEYDTIYDALDAFEAKVKVDTQIKSFQKQIESDPQSLESLQSVIDNTINNPANQRILRGLEAFLGKKTGSLKFHSQKSVAKPNDPPKQKRKVTKDLPAPPQRKATRPKGKSKPKSKPKNGGKSSKKTANSVAKQRASEVLEKSKEVLQGPTKSSKKGSKSKNQPRSSQKTTVKSKSTSKKVDTSAKSSKISPKSGGDTKSTKEPFQSSKMDSSKPAGKEPFTSSKMNSSKPAAKEPFKSSKMDSSKAAAKEPLKATKIDTSKPVATKTTSKTTAARRGKSPEPRSPTSPMSDSGRQRPELHSITMRYSEFDTLLIAAVSDVQRKDSRNFYMSVSEGSNEGFKDVQAAVSAFEKKTRLDVKIARLAAQIVEKSRNWTEARSDIGKIISAPENIKLLRNLEKALTWEVGSISFKGVPGEIQPAGNLKTGAVDRKGDKIVHKQKEEKKVEEEEEEYDDEEYYEDEYEDEEYYEDEEDYEDEDEYYYEDEPDRGTLEHLQWELDRSLNNPCVTFNDVRYLLNQSISLNSEWITVHSMWVPFSAQYLRKRKAKVKLCATVGYPLGCNSTTAKTAEAGQAAKEGASRIRLMVSTGKIIEQDWKYITNEVRKVVAAAAGCDVRVIFPESPEVSELLKKEFNTKLAAIKY